MIKYILTLSLFGLLAAMSPLYGQSNRDLGQGQEPEPNPKVNEPLVNRHIEGEIPGFHVAIDFEVMPAPLIPARATVTLTVGEGYAWSERRPPAIDFVYWEKKVRWLSEPTVTLPVEAQPGQVFRIQIEFLCLESDECGFQIYDHHDRRYPALAQSMSIEICLDENGELTRLRGARGLWSCGHIETVFFAGDSVRMLSGRGVDTTSSQMFVGDCTVVPPFRIGEPSKVCYNLKFIRDYPHGLDLEFSYSHMEIIDLPPAVKGPIFAGDEMQFCVTAVPLPVRDVHGLDMSVYPRDHYSGDDTFPMGAVFNDDGSLRYIHDNLYLGEGEEFEKRLPKAFPLGTTATCGSKWVLRSE